MHLTTQLQMAGLSRWVDIRVLAADLLLSLCERASLNGYASDTFEYSRISYVRWQVRRSCGLFSNHPKINIQNAVGADPQILSVLDTIFLHIFLLHFRSSFTSEDLFLMGWLLFVVVLDLFFIFSI